MVSTHLAAADRPGPLRLPPTRPLLPLGCVGAPVPSGQVRKELMACYDLISRMGRGIVYYGSARIKPGSPHWDRAVELSQRLWRLMGVTTWTGGGPGLMEAASKATSDIGGRSAGIRISREAGTRVLTSTYLPPEHDVVCKASKRKVRAFRGSTRTPFPPKEKINRTGVHCVRGHRGAASDRGRG